MTSKHHQINSNRHVLKVKSLKFHDELIWLSEFTTVTNDSVPSLTAAFRNLNWLLSWVKTLCEYGSWPVGPEPTWTLQSKTWGGISRGIQTSGANWVCTCRWHRCPVCSGLSLFPPNCLPGRLNTEQSSCRWTRRTPESQPPNTPAPNLQGGKDRSERTLGKSEFVWSERRCLCLFLHRRDPASEETDKYRNVVFGLSRMGRGGDYKPFSQILCAGWAQSDTGVPWRAPGIGLTSQTPNWAGGTDTSVLLREDRPISCGHRF